MEGPEGIESSDHKNEWFNKGKSEKVKSCLLLSLFLFFMVFSVEAHIIPPEKYHPVAESYRRMNFMLNLNPILWKDVRNDTQTIADQMIAMDAQAGEKYRQRVQDLIDQVNHETDPIDPDKRREMARKIFEFSTQTVAQLLILNIEIAEENLTNYQKAQQAFNVSRQIWASFEHEINAADPQGFMTVGRAWLALSNSLGYPGLFDKWMSSRDSKCRRRTIDC